MSSWLKFIVVSGASTIVLAAYYLAALQIEHRVIISNVPQSCSTDGKWETLNLTTCSGYRFKNGSVYFFDNEVRNADAYSFEVFCDRNEYVSTFARDEQHVFLDGNPLAGIDSQTFCPFGAGFYAKDGNSAYYFSTMQWGQIPADIVTFFSDDFLGEYAKDSTHIYLRHNILKSADPATFQKIGRSPFSRDKKTVFYFDGHTSSAVSGADPVTFEPYPQIESDGRWLYSMYGRDEKFVYCGDNRLPDVDPSMLVVVSQIAARAGAVEFINCQTYNGI